MPPVEIILCNKKRLPLMLFPPFRYIDRCVRGRVRLIKGSSQNVMRARRAKGLPVASALMGLVPFFAPWVVIPTWLALRPRILTEHLIPFIFFIGIAFAYQVGLMITAHLTKSPFPFFNVLYLPITIGAIDAVGPWLKGMTAFYGDSSWGWNSVLGNVDEYQLAYVMACLGLAIGVHGSFIYDVVTNICDYMDIWCLTIKYRRDLGQEPPPHPDAKEVKAH